MLTGSKYPILKGIVLATFIEFLVLELVMLGPAGANYSAFLLYYTLIFIFYLLASFCLTSATAGKHVLAFVLVTSLIFRFTLLFSELNLSNDLFRYIWDGKLLANGINPFAYKPENPVLSSLRDGLYYQMAYKHYFTIYPPLSQLFFALIYNISPTVVGFKMIFVLFDVGSILVLHKLLEMNNVNKSNIIYYAWNPLILIEYAGSGHYDSIGVFLLLATLLLMRNGKRYSGSLCLAASVLVKLMPAMFIPYLLRRIRVQGLIVVALTILTFYLLFSIGAPNPFGSLEIYYYIWRFNDFAFTGILRFLEFIGANNPLSNAKRLAGLILLFWMGFLFFQKENRTWTTEKKVFFSMIALLLLSPTLHPWYLTWAVPFFALFPNMSGLLLSYTIIFSYSVLATDYYTGFVGNWSEVSAHKWLEFLPFYLMLAVEVCKPRIKGLQKFLGKSD